MLRLTAALIRLSVNTFPAKRLRRGLYICAASLILCCAQSAAAAGTPTPVLISEPDSTRAIALESVEWTPQPFSPTTTSLFYGPDHRTRITLFVMNLALQPGENLSSVVSGDAEDFQFRHYQLEAEDLRPVPGQEWMSQLVLRLNENLGDVGDVLVSLSYRNVVSNHVRVGIGHMGGGRPDYNGEAPTPAPPYIISGRVTSGATALQGVLISLSGQQGGEATTDKNGEYSMFVSAPGDYTLTPSKEFYTFAPASRALNNLNGKRSADFQATRVAFAISGQIKDDENKPLGGAAVTLSGTQQAATVTGVDGKYSFTNLTAGGHFAVTASAQFFNLNPSNLVFDFLSANETAANFTGSRKLYAISGQVRDDQGNALNGVAVTLKSSASPSSTRVLNTGSDGFFSFTNVPAGYSYTITPASSSLYAFTSTETEVLGGNLSLSFNATRQKYTISGRTTDGQNGVDGVQLVLTGRPNLGPLPVVTSGGGIFSFPNLPAGYDYKVIVTTNAFYAFSQQEFTNLLSDQAAVFTGTLRHYTVSGIVTDETDAPLSGNIVGLYTDNLSVTKSAVTGADGRFEFTDIPASYSYRVFTYNIPTHDFAPQVVSALGADRSLKLTGVRRHYAISGVLKDRANQGVGGVSVTLSGIVNRTATTGTDGIYTFDDLPAGFVYDVSVAKTDYIFEPRPSASIYLLRDTKADFTAIRTYRISGRVTDAGGHGLIGMTMNLSGAEPGKVVTGVDGSYLFTVTTAGNYLLKPAKEQDFYTFAPASRNLNNLNDHVTANFVATFSPITAPAYVLEFDGNPMNVDYGLFWPEGIELGHFYWEFWAMPGNDTYTKYMLSDGYGGAHALLFGFNYGNDGRYNLFGNIWDGAKANFFNSDEGPVAGEWGHYAVGWDGKYVITYYDGVPVGKQSFTGPRSSPGRSWGASLLGIGGSDHQNLVGRLAQVRGYEDNNPREGAPESTFTPQTVFSLDGQLLSYFFRQSQQIADLSSGYNGGTHAGRLRGMHGYLVECPECPPPQFVIDPTAPDFSNPNNPGQVNAPVSGPPLTPDGSLIFDSFSRNNSTYILGGKGGLSATEAGTMGPLNWQTSTGQTQPQPFGILGGHAVLLGNDAALAWVSTAAGVPDLDVRVERTLGKYGSGDNTGLCFRVVDKNNFFFAYTASDESDASGPKKLTLGYYQSGARTVISSGIALPATGWKTLSVVTKQTGSISIYADGALVYSVNSAVFAAATGAGLYNAGSGLGLTNRWDNFTVLSAP